MTIKTYIGDGVDVHTVNGILYIRNRTQTICIDMQTFKELEKYVQSLTEPPPPVPSETRSQETP